MLKPADIQLRLQNMDWNNSTANRKQNMTLAEMQQKLAREEMGQRGSQFLQSNLLNRDQFGQTLSANAFSAAQQRAMQQYLAQQQAQSNLTGNLLGFGSNIVSKIF